MKREKARKSADSLIGNILIASALLALTSCASAGVGRCSASTLPRVSTALSIPEICR